MKLLLAGNLANYGYFLTKLIRKNGLDAHLLMEKYPQISSDPKSFEENLREYPNWIDFWDNKKGNWKYQIIKKMSKFDLIQSSTELPIFSLFSGKPNISWPTGSDVFELAHENNLKGFLLRTAYKRSKLVIFAGLYMYSPLQKLKIKKKLFIPPIWDYSKFIPNKVSTKNSEFIIFHPTGHTWHQKGNDIFLKSFVKFAKIYSNVKLVMIKRGPDFEKSFNMLKKEDLLKKVKILPNTLKQKELIEWYRQANVVVDQFIFGSTGLIGQETMASEKPLIQYVDKNLHEKFYSENPPILNASNDNEIFECLTKIIEDHKLGEKIGRESREWLLKHHNLEKNIKKYLNVYQGIFSNRKVERIIDEVNSM